MNNTGISKSVELIQGLTKAQFSILAHSLGRQEDGQRKESQSQETEDFRNSFVTGEETTDYPNCMSLVEKGLMQKTSSVLLSKGQFFFFVTKTGIELVNAQAKVAKSLEPKLTAAQLRYRRYVKVSDMFENFLQFCRWDAQQQRDKKLGLIR